ncbi:hypothetical protein L6164_018307 [Bauhinia variegata]|uniref:Uncharacterized protein n=1 Tax=Bauhinia variegata TaxID=167791 RepID=A0ACB9NBU7_BAUVA|nr:hypothetical protein L6164_018307 [Bauhinia variegata]
MEVSVSTPKLVPFLFFTFLALKCFSNSGTRAQLIPQEEVKVLQAISDKVEKLNWKISQRSCSGDDGFMNRYIQPIRGNDIIRNVTCNCTFQSGTVCYVTNIDLARNYLSGSIPKSFSQLPLLVLTLIDNRLSGTIPAEIGNIARLESLNMQGTSMEGPIPPTIAQLKNLIQLRISDLSESGPPTTFPDLKELKNLRYLILRNCKITGQIPDYIGEMKNLYTLDLSFNKLTGSVPDTFQGLERLSFMNLASSHSASTNNPIWCLKKGLPCGGKPQYDSLFINCGGGRMEFEGNEYDEDPNPEGFSNFFSGDKWAYSSTGVYFDNDRADHIARNELSLNISGPEYYKTARLSPLSLKYYGLCLLKGSYKVKLHFAEIQYSNDQTFSGIGRRIFDVLIQDNLYLKDFNIMEEAGGAGKGITKVFDVDVNDSTVEIHLYWAGKGTTAVPNRGVYGPLISAITVTPNFRTSSKRPLTGANGIAAALGVLLVLILIVVLIVLRKKGFLGGKNSKDKELLNLKTGYFSLRQIKAATGNFDPANKIGEGGFGPVYKAFVLQEQGNLIELVDPTLSSSHSPIEAMRMLNLALLCTNSSPSLRPSMSSVVNMLEGKAPVQPPITQNKDTNGDAKFKAFETTSLDSQTLSSYSFSEERLERRVKSMDGPWIDSSTSLPSAKDYSSPSRLLKNSGPVTW